MCVIFNSKNREKYWLSKFALAVFSETKQLLCLSGGTGERRPLTEFKNLQNFLVLAEHDCDKEET